MARKVGSKEICPERNEGKFWPMLREMEENDEHNRLFSGSLECGGFFRAIYRGRVQMGFEDENK